MAIPTKNPFRFGDPVEDDYYFPRPGLTKIVHQFLENKIHVALIGPRRFGKTSFIRDLIRHEEKKGETCILIDIFNVTSHRDFLQQLVRALRTKGTWVSKLKKWAAGISRLKPQFTWEIDPMTGRQTFSIASEVSSDKDVKELIQDVLGGLTSLGAKVIVAIDEFQAVAELEDSGWLEATLRTQMQQTSNMVFLFSGSRRSLIHDMLNNPKRPFYRTCQIIDFPAFDADFTDWVIARFRTVGVKCDKAAIEQLRELVQDTPNYVQMACFHLVAQGIARIDSSMIGEVLYTIVKQNAYAYQTLLNALTPTQQRALRLSAFVGEEIYSKETLKRFEISSGPALASAIKSLKDKQILDEGTKRGKVIFDDPLFAIWLRTEFGT